MEKDLINSNLSSLSGYSFFLKGLPVCLYQSVSLQDRLAKDNITETLFSGIIGTDCLTFHVQIEIGY